MPARFFCPDPPSDGVYRLKAGEAKHLSRVCGSESAIWSRSLTAAAVRPPAGSSPWETTGWILPPSASRSPSGRLRFPLVLATAAPKADRFDWLVEKATELGVARLIPLISERSVVEPGASKISRLERTVIEASKQCGRTRLMVIDPPTGWSAVVESFPDSLRYLADPQGIPPDRLPGIATGQPVDPGGRPRGRLYRRPSASRPSGPGGYR